MKKKKLGIIGGGQLGRMLTLAAQKLDIETIILDPTPNSPAGQVAKQQIVGDFKDPQKIKELASRVDFLTFEIESANAKTMEELEKSGVSVQPSPQTLKIIQDKFTQKSYFNKLKIPSAQFASATDKKSIEKIAKKFKYPIMVKSRFGGYDGRGNVVVKSPGEIQKALSKLKGDDVYIEEYITFEKELAIQVARTKDGKTTIFPLVDTVQKNNICHLVIAPADVSKSVEKKAIKLAQKVVDNLKGAGVFGIEMFLDKNGQVLLNEIAPRVHNSGHYTIEACEVSQFEQHVRAVCNLPLRKTGLKTKAAVMVNILGERNGPAQIIDQKTVAKNGVFVHIYGKKETRKERKMGHITVIGDLKQELLNTALNIRKAISI